MNEFICALESWRDKELKYAAKKRKRQARENWESVNFGVKLRNI